uniref:Uncharacterized protein n=1 Tax=Arundo donax TaxID=35708 RepID=A0A0A9F5D8_ARUDO
MLSLPDLLSINSSSCRGPRASLSLVAACCCWPWC